MSTPNPFLADPVTNPFLPPEQQTPAALIALPPCGDRDCARSHRPNGDHYSSDSSLRVKQMNEDGKMGGKAFGALGGARKTQKRRATEIVAEAAAEHAESIKQVFIDGIDANNPIGIRLQAAKEFLKVEESDIERDLAERKAEFDAMNKEQLVGSITEMLSKLGAAGQIAAEVEEMVEADVVD